MRNNKQIVYILVFAIFLVFIPILSAIMHLKEGHKNIIDIDNIFLLASLVLVLFVIFLLLYLLQKYAKQFEQKIDKLHEERENIEESLLNSEMNMNKIFEVNPNIMITTDGSNISRANEAMLEFTGFNSLSEFQKQYDCICDLFLSDNECLQKIMNEIAWLDYILSDSDKIHKVCMQNNEKIYTFVVSAKIINEDNKECLVSFTDITELEKVYADNSALKSVEKELRASKQQFDLFMQNIPAYITIKHNNGRVIYSNNAAASFFKRESIIGLNSYELLPRKYASGFDELNKKALRDGYSEEVFEFIDEKSKKMFFRVMTFAIPQEHSNKVHIGSIYFDITEQYKDQHEISKFKQVLENSPVSIIITDINGKIEYVNPKFTKLSGYTLQEVIGKNPNIVKSDYTSKDDYEKLWKVISSGQVWSGIFKNIKKNGDIFWESAIIIPIKNTLDKIVNYISIKQEVTQEISLREELKNKEEIMIAQSRHAAMGEMIGMIAHQWRQPISIVAMIANNMLLDVELDEVNKDGCNTQANDIIEQTEYLSKTIDDFRNFFRPNKEKDITCIEDVISETQKIIGSSLEYSSIELSIKNGNKKQIKTYSRELLQVFINIIKNAKEALVENRENDRKITINIADDEKNVVTTFCDNGGGIDKDIIDKIFEPYYSTKTEKTGTGLGLYMSKTIIQKHLNGTISVENFENGACFKISIPT